MKVFTTPIYRHVSWFRGTPVKVASVRWVYLVALLVLMLPATVQARRVPIPIPMPKVIYAPCPGIADASGCSDEGTIWVRPGTDRFVLEHELGHAFVDTRMNDGERNRFQRYIRMLGYPWVIPDPLEVGGVSRSSPSEQVADAYANCALGNGIRRRRHGVIQYHWESSTTYSPTPRLHKAVCAFFWRAAKQP